MPGHEKPWHDCHKLNHSISRHGIVRPEMLTVCRVTDKYVDWTPGLPRFHKFVVNTAATSSSSSSTFYLWMSKLVRVLTQAEWLHPHNHLSSVRIIITLLSSPLSSPTSSWTQVRIKSDPKWLLCAVKVVRQIVLSGAVLTQTDSRLGKEGRRRENFSDFLANKF